MIRNFFMMIGLSLLVGCGGSAPTGPALPADAGEAITEAHGLILESTYGGGLLKSAKDLDAFESRFPKAVAAIKSGEVKVIWGKAVKDNSPSPEVIAYEKAAESGEGWAIKDNGKLEKVTSADLPKGK
ncbi:hypothetical protein SH467x_001256 [Pirellulaceae bacterium SH467]